MPSSIPIQLFLEAAESEPVIDVRSPSEFKQGHIPGACNIPLFDDDERAEVGTLYKQQSRDVAFKRGLEIVGPKMRVLVEEAEHTAPDQHVLIYCWRGGMRSNSFAWLLESAGFQTQTLQKGYKAFRNFALDCFTKEKSIHILSGHTGSGKTEILHALRELGEQVIDLEGLANHKGSAFGHLGENDQPTGEQFQNMLAIKWNKVDKHKPIWLEDESKFIGRRIIPKDLFEQMKTAPVFRLEVPKECRINRLVDNYGDYPLPELKESISKIKKRLGGLRTQQAVEALEEGKLKKVVDSVLHYYDKAYDHQIEKRKDHKVMTLTVEDSEPSTIARSLVDQTIPQTT